MSSLYVAVLLPGKEEDGGWVESAARAVVALRRSKWQLYAIPQPGASSERIFRQTEELVRSETHLIIGHGYEYIESFLTLAPNHPQTYFFAMDTLSKERNWPKNFCCLYQRQDEAAFLCGRLAAHLTERNRLGFLGGKEVRTQVKNAGAFERGAKSLNPAIDVFTNFTGTFEDPEQGYEMGLEMIERGADVLMHTASETGNGLIEACNQRDVFVIGYTLDQHKLAPQQMITSLIVDVPRIYQRKIEEVAGARFRSGIWEVGLTDGMVGLAPFSGDVPASVRTDLGKVRNAITDGEIII